MNRIIASLILGAGTMAITSTAQGTFQNLDFESARVIFAIPGSTGDIAATNAFPAWSVFAGTNQPSIVQFGNLGGFFPVMLYARTNGGSISGEFSLLLSWTPGHPDKPRGSVSQTGLVPMDTQSLLFKVSTIYSGFFDGPFSVSLGGQSLACTALSNGTNYILYGADVSLFAGQTSTLIFQAGAGTEYGLVMLDDIQFSPTAIPEPSAVGVLGLGTFAFAVRQLRRHRFKP